MEKEILTYGKRYPTITFRITKDRKKMLFDEICRRHHHSFGKVLNKLIDCYLKNPDCLVRDV